MSVQTTIDSASELATSIYTTFDVKEATIPVVENSNEDPTIQQKEVLAVKTPEAYRTVITYEDLISNDIKYEFKMEKLENKILKLETERQEERIRNDLKLDKERKELQEERDRIIKEMQDKINVANKEREEERNRIIKEKEDDRSRFIALEAMYQTRIQKLEAQREEERVRNDMKLEKERKILEEERSRYIKIEAKLEERESKFDIERNELKKVMKEKDSKHELERNDLLKLVLSSSQKLKKDKTTGEARVKNPSSESEENISTLASNTNILSNNHHKVDSDSDVEGKEIVTAKNANVFQLPNAGWATFLKGASKLKLKCFLASLFISLWRFIWYIASYFLVAPKLYCLEEIVFFTYTAFYWLLASLLSRFALITLTGRYYDDANIEMSPPAIAKVEMFVLLFLINGISQVFGNVTINTFYLYYKQDWMLIEMKEDEAKRNFKYIFRTKLKVELITNVLNWLMFLIIIGISSVQNISNLDPNFEILLFGYLFPMIKAGIVTVFGWGMGWYGKTARWSSEYSSKMASAASCAAVILCTLPQLYCVFRGANDPSFFLYQYVPHEIIKKLSWLTFHPLYLKTKLQVLDVLTKVYESARKKKDKVNPMEDRPSKEDRRFSLEVYDSLAAVAGDIFGRQFGEDMCMILMTFYMLPLCQQYLFPQIYKSSSSQLPFPSNQSIGVMIIGVAYTLETVSTIICSAMLERVGILIKSNAQAVEPHRKSFLFYIFAVVSWVIMLTASTVY